MLSPSLFTEFRSKLRSFSELPNELKRIQSFPAKRPLTNHFEQLPRQCIFIEYWTALDWFDGPVIATISASHELADESERDTAIAWVECAIDSDNRIVVSESRSLDFSQQLLSKPGSLNIAAGWTADPEIGFRGFFADIRPSCTPHDPPVEYYSRFWREIFKICELDREISIQTRGMNWYVSAAGKMKVKSTVGSGGCENPKGLAIFGFETLSEVRQILERLSTLGQTTSIRTSCTAAKGSYDRIRSYATGLLKGWKVNIAGNLTAADRDAFAQGHEPVTNRLPGACFSWPEFAREPSCSFSCGFHRIDGHWWSVLGTYSKSQSAEHDFASMLAVHGYKKTV